MATVLILDNDRGNREDITRYLQKAGHNVFALDGQTASSLFAAFEEQLRDNRDCRWDFAILDIHHTNDAWGGFRLWDRIKKEGLNTRFTHVIVCTMYMEGDDADAYLRVRRFAKENGIPPGNLVDFKRTDVDWLVKRIQDLLPKDNPAQKAASQGEQ